MLPWLGMGAGRERTWRINLFIGPASVLANIFIMRAAKKHATLTNIHEKGALKK